MVFFLFSALKNQEVMASKLLFRCVAVLVLILSSQNALQVLNAAEPGLFTDKQALLSFKSQVVVDPSNTLSSWNDNSSPCNWTRVDCSQVHQRVIGLDLSGLRLTGSISPHIGNLSFLRSLHLQENQFTGVIPDQIGALFRLKVLNMSFNTISGPIPLNITNCLNLQILDLMQNEISGAIPEELSNLKSLEILKLGGNKLWGMIPPFIANISSLLTLDLITNNLGGMIPADLGRLENIKHLDLSINNLTGDVPLSLYNISSLVFLAVASNQLRGQIPIDVGDRLPNLLSFNFCFNKFTGSIPWSLHNVTNMQSVRMSHNLFSGSVPPRLGNIPKLTLYNIGFNQIKSSGDGGLNFLSSFINSSYLKFLAINDNLLEGLIPESIGNLSRSLRNLYLGENQIYGSIPASIRHLSSLALLNISYSHVSGEIPPEIGELTDLQELHLTANKISGRIPDSLGNLQKLNKIDLSANELVGRLPTTFVNFQQLQSMDLSSNRLNGSIPKEIFNLSSLSATLNLSSNQLTGPLPQEIRRLENVAAVDFSHNYLSGSIPDTIGSCKSLEELFIDNNMLSGSIPATLGDVKGLEILDLSSNQISGIIPKTLENLQALLLLNLSFNNLEGPLPKGAFRNLSRIHVEGNLKLCLDLSCWNNEHRQRISTAIYIVIAGIAAAAVCSVIAVLLCVKKRKGEIMPRSDSIKLQHPTISYGELREAAGSFDAGNLIGKGSFGSVYKGELRDATIVAVKVLDSEKYGSWKSFLAECEALKNVRHRNLIKLITSCSSMDNRGLQFLALVYEYMHNGSLEEWIKGSRRRLDGGLLNILERLNVAIDVACAVDYLHHDCEIPVVHCDLKPSNVLVDKDMTAKVGDFGLAKLLADKQSISCTGGLRGSVGYIPPEYGLGLKATTSGDVYSYGVVLLELFTGKSPTHEIFSPDLSLIKWVKSAFPANIEEVVNPELLLSIKDFHHGAQFESPEKQHECLIAILGVGLSCTFESPDQRITMRDSLHKLKKARDTLLKLTLDHKPYLDLEVGIVHRRMKSS
ncbi:probable LRR receptor-like serine/threonine-protein kinase At3g47570 [Populus nigra]|uniref:probable LRR receptor-like serine/threonine-protein kinase At3g47570 n=1 Tax=Populus nigra TaxID=3691 RepID=UPI002B2781E1|nr:probable LRR receptor-like serine/threonine-protein kinase At3g47570 [Populus nigra]